MAALASSSSHCAERGIDPRACDDARAVARSDPGLVRVDQDIERSGIDIAFLREHRLQRADAHLHFAELAVLVVLMLRHGAMLARSGRERETRGSGIAAVPLDNAQGNLHSAVQLPFEVEPHAGRDHPRSLTCELRSNR